MSTLIHFWCRAPLHLLAPSRRGIGGLVIRHGTTAYCDGVGVDDRHRWVPTGGVPIETLFGDALGQIRLGEGDDDRPRAGHLSDERGHPHPLATPS